MRETKKYLGGFLTAFFELGKIIKNLKFENYSPDFKHNLSRRGLRNGDPSRNLAETIKVFETIPAPVRAQGESAASNFISGKDWSHIKSRHNGGGNEASNGMFERSDLNRARGAKDMDSIDIFKARWDSYKGGFRASVKQISIAMVKGAFIEGGIEFLFATWENVLLYFQGQIPLSKAINKIKDQTLNAAINENVLLYFQGQITLPKAINKIKDQTLNAAINGAFTTGLLITATLIFPPIGIVLEALALFFAVHGIVSMLYRIWGLLLETDKTFGFTKQALAY